MELNTPKRIKTLTTYANSPPESDSSVLSSWNWPENCSSSPDSCDSPEISRQNNNANNFFNDNQSENRENRRGRPRSEALANLMIEGTTSPSAIKCSYCNRVFPREKSLQAHLRIHTGERPYPCDYPACARAFTQSGQLKTHQRLHTGERPFICSAPTCQMRFTHANRHCPDHPYDQLKRCDNFIIQTIPEQNIEVIKWLDKYRMEREDRTPTRKTPKRSKQLKDNNENFRNCENEFPVTPNNSYKSRKGLMIELDMNAGQDVSPLTVKNKPNPKMIQWQEPLSQEEDSSDEMELPVRSTFNPKKRWLREACQDDLARPLEFTSSTTMLSPTSISSTLLSSPTTTTTISNNLIKFNNISIINPNQTRPTVLMVASKDKTMPLSCINDNIIKSTVIPLPPPPPPTPLPLLSPPTQPPIDENRKWLGALALMELATDDGQHVTEIIRNNLRTIRTTIPTHSSSSTSSVIQSYTQL